MAIAGQRAAQGAQRAGTQSARALGRVARRASTDADVLIVQLDTGWVRITCDPETGCETQEPYEMTLDREV